jgi:hypothetical protein
MDTPYKSRYYKPADGVDIWVYKNPNKILINAGSGSIYVTLEDVNSGPGLYKPIFDAQVSSSGLLPKQVYATMLKAPCQLNHSRFLFPSIDLSKRMDVPITGSIEFFAGDKYWYDSKNLRVLSWRMAIGSPDTYCFYYGGKWGLTTDIPTPRLQTACMIKITPDIYSVYPDAAAYASGVLAASYDGAIVTLTLYGYLVTTDVTFSLIRICTPLTFASSHFLISEFTADATKIATVTSTSDTFGLDSQKVDVYTFSANYTTYTKTTPMPTSVVQGAHVVSTGSGGTTLPTPALLTGNWSWSWTKTLVGSQPKIIQIRAEGNVFTAVAQNYTGYSLSESGTATLTTAGSTTTKSTSSSGTYSFSVSFQLLSISTTGYTSGYSTPTISGTTTISASGNFITGSGIFTSSGTESITSTGHSDGGYYTNGTPLAICYYSNINNCIIYRDAYPSSGLASSISGSSGSPTVLTQTQDTSITYTYRLASASSIQTIYTKTTSIVITTSTNTFSSTDHIDPWRAVSDAQAFEVPSRANSVDPEDADYIIGISALPVLNYDNTTDGQSYSYLNLAFTDKVVVACIGTLPFSITVGSTTYGPYTYVAENTAYIDPVKKIVNLSPTRIDKDTSGITYPLSATHK